MRKKRLAIWLILALLASVLIYGGYGYRGGDEEDEDKADYTSSAEVTLSGASPAKFNPTSSVLVFDFSETFTDIQLYHQGMPLDAVTVSPNRAAVGPFLEEGRNEVTLFANDADGNVILEEYVLWAGDHTRR